MKIYVACHCQKLATSVANELRAEGFEITSRWLTQPFGPTGTFSDRQCRAFALENFDDVKAADALVLVAGPDRYSGGKFIETGYAYAKDKLVFLLGRRENLMLHGPGFRLAKTRKTLTNQLRKARRQWFS